MRIGKHHHDHLKLFVPRNGSELPAAEQEASCLANRNKDITRWNKAARKEKKRGDELDADSA
jgi:hypothetical protein